ncbi:MAG: hypothetical protein WCK77_14520 [Verrucomicrobiota bacterium]
MFHDHVAQNHGDHTPLPETEEPRLACDSNPITIQALAERWKCCDRTIHRNAPALGLVQIKGCSNQTVYELPSPDDEARMKETLSCSFRRNVRVRKTLVPSQRIVISAIEAVAGPVSKAALDRVNLTLATILQTTIRCNDPEMVVQIGSQKLEALVGKRHAQPIVRLLMDSSLIHRCHGYIRGDQCFGYRLDPTCFKDCETILLSWPVRKASKPPPRSSEAQPLNSPHSPEVLRRLETDLAKLGFAADLDIEDLADEAAAAKLVKIHASPKRRAKGHLDDEARANHARLCIMDTYRRFNGIPRPLKPKEKSLRIYHVVACMPRILREHLQFDGQPMCSIDIRCSQPFFLGLLFLENQATDGLDPMEIADYLELTQSGQFYEWLMDELGEDHAHRSHFKTVVFRDLLFGKRHCSRTPVFHAFARRFPSLGHNLQKLHQDTFTLALRLQRTESATIYGHVLPAVQAAHPHDPIITIHDAIMVPSSIAEPAMDLFLRTLSHKSPHLPSLSISPSPST